MFATEMENNVGWLVEAIKADYIGWMERCAKGEEISGHQKDMVDRFCDGIAVKEGKKYIKITTGGSVWGFIVNTDTDKKFRKGDILKAAGYNAPARNAARGNIVDGGYTIQWTGPLYLN